MRQHDPIVIDRFMGLWDRSNEDTDAFFGDGFPDDCPQDHAIAFDNFRFNNGGIRRRPGTSMTQLLATGAGLFRKHTFQFSGGDRDLMMDATRRLIDRQTAAVLVTGPIGSSDFCLVNLFDRAYISFFNPATGGGIGSLYVYDGTTIRIAGGTAPVGSITVAVGAAGKIESGYHPFAVAFETASGFITKAGGFNTYGTAGGVQVNLSTIPLGPAGTVARHILATKTAYTGWVPGNFNDIEFFFVPGGKIPDNVTTTYTANFYDADLVASADYLLDQLETIPAGMSMCELSGRLCIAGFFSPNDSMLRVSKSGQPEAFSAIDGFVLARPGDGGQIKAITTHRDSVMIHKALRTSVTSDNTLPPAQWPVLPIDNIIGTESSNGINKIVNVSGPSVDYYLIAANTGLQRYSGGFDLFPLTWKVEGIWRRITPNFAYLIQVIDDAINKRIYITLPLDDSEEINYVLYGDYKLGLDFNNIRWSLWQFPVPPKSISARIDTATKTILVEYMDENGSLLKIDATVPSDVDSGGGIQPIISTHETAYLPIHNNGEFNHFTGLRSRVFGTSGTFITPSARTLDTVITYTLPNLFITPSPGKLISIGPFSVTAERLSFRFIYQSATRIYEMRKLVIFVKPIYLDGPNQPGSQT